MQPPPTRPRALLFDMDGTLTRPMLDFPRIKAEMGIGDRPILEALLHLSPDARRTAEAVLLRHEEQAARESTLNDGCHEVLAWARSRAIATALITRNSRTSVQTVLRTHGLTVDVILSREDAAPKPDPLPLRLACDRLGVTPRDAWMVGDGQYDIEAGLAAGITTVWISHGRDRTFAAKPSKVAENLCELQLLLEQAHAI